MQSQGGRRRPRRRQGRGGAADGEKFCRGSGCWRCRCNRDRCWRWRYSSFAGPRSGRNPDLFEYLRAWRRRITRTVFPGPNALRTGRSLLIALNPPLPMSNDGDHVSVDAKGKEVPSPWFNTYLQLLQPLFTLGLLVLTLLARRGSSLEALRLAGSGADLLSPAML